MKRGLILFGVLAGVLVLLLVALFLIPDPVEEEEGAAAAQEGAYITLYEVERLRAVTISPRDQESFVLRYTAESYEDLDAAEDCVLVGMEELPLYTALIQSVLAQSRTLEAIELVVEDTDDPAQFGLDAPNAHVTVEDYDGNFTVFTIGNMAPVGDGYYARVAGDDAVYFVSNTTAQRYMGGPLTYLSKVVTPGAYAQFGEITFGGTVREQLGEVIIADIGEGEGTSTGDYAIVVPVSRGLSSADGAYAVNAVFGLQALDVVTIYPTDEELALYGLTEPYHATASVVSDELGSFTVIASAADANDIVYLMRQDVPLVYVADISSLPWLDMQYYEFMDRMPLAVAVYDVAGVRVQTPTRGAAFTLSVDNGELLVEYGGRQLDAAGFQNYYTTLISAPQADYTDEQPEEGASPLLTVTLTLHDGTVRTARYYESEEARRCLFVYGDGRAFGTPQMFVERAVEDLERVVEDLYVLPYTG